MIRFGDDMKSIDSEHKFCPDCNLNVKDYSKNKKVEINSTCGRFNVSQIQSFTRNQQVNSSKAVTVSLIVLLGLTAVNHNLNAQTPQTDYKTVRANNQKDKLEIKGILLDKESERPLRYGTVQIYSESNLIGVAMTNHSGEFSVRIDTVKYNLENLQITLDIGRDITTDTVRIRNQGFQNIALELKVNTTWFNSHEYSITGDITIDEHSVYNRQSKRKE